MGERRVTPEMIEQARQSLAARESEQPIDRALAALAAGLVPDPQDAAILIESVSRARDTQKGRRLLGMKPRTRGKEPRYDAASYSHESPEGNVAKRFSQGTLTHAEACLKLAEHVGAANNKTLKKLLTDLCAHLHYPWPALRARNHKGSEPT